MSDASRSEHLPVAERAQLARASTLAQGMYAKQYQLEPLAIPEAPRTVTAGDAAGVALVRSRPGPCPSRTEPYETYEPH
ncbi:hypothetical protein KZO11_08760 [Streptomyces anulatus]|uniref:hypothetical protein n=1 Tax=Streptomyces anulatus TaxID=1892 RepID=UPI001C5F6C8B|nr:hypothetical protein [Streptomyces anulatus]QYA93798.1 hypothetical protein KZO11_08760 [Streptomyces anulatus]